MNKKSKILSAILIVILIISNISAQTTLLASNLSSSNPSLDSTNDESLQSPESSDVSGSYNFDDGNTMDIDAIDDTTTTTLNNNINEEYIEIKSEKNDTSASTIFNDSASIIADSELGFQLEAENFNLNMPDANQLDILYYDYELHTNAIIDDDDSLESFYTKLGDPLGNYFNVSYTKDDPDGYNLELLISSGITVNLDYDEDKNEFKWFDDSYFQIFPNAYIINESGVWEGDTQVIDWTTSDLEDHSIEIQFPFPPFTPLFQINISKYYNTTVIHYYYVPGHNHLYELVFTKLSSGIISMKFENLIIDLWIDWTENIISLYDRWIYDSATDYPFVTFYLWDIIDLIYIVVWESAFIEVKFLWEWNLIIWDSISMEVWFLEDYLLVILIFHWYWWTFKIQIWFNILLEIFESYIIFLEYKSWIYIYYVPTLILPNFLTINIIEAIYTDLWFYITISVKDFLGYTITGVTITGSWDGAPIGTVEDNNDGTYNFTLPAKFVASGGDPLWLNITANKVGYAEGGLNTEIAVEPTPIPEFPKQLQIKIVESIYLDDSFNLKVEVTNCSGYLEAGTSLSGTWNFIDLTPLNITNHGDGTIDLILTPIYVPAGGDPIWLNLTATKTGYINGELITEIAVEPTAIPEVPKQLQIKIVESIYLTDSFNLKVEVTNCSGDLEAGSSLSGKWNGISLTPLNITDNLDGTFDLALTPKYVPVGGDPIWLNLTSTKTGYIDAVLNTEIAVEPTPIPEFPKQLQIKIVESIYLDDSFNLKVEVTNCSGDLEVGSSLSGKWNGISLTLENITNNGDGTFDLKLTPIYVPAGGDPIWLNLTSTKTGYIDGVLNTEIAVEPFYTGQPPPPPKQLIIKIINSIYTSEWFNLTVEITNCSGIRETGTTLVGKWNGIDLTLENITNNGDGTYNLSITAILVLPGDPGIWLNLSATKIGYINGVLNTEIAVDPDTVNSIKIPQPPSPTPPSGDGGNGGAGKEGEAISGPSIILISIISVIAVTSIAFNLIKRKRKY